MKKILLSSLCLFFALPVYAQHAPQEALPASGQVALARENVFERCYQLEQGQVLKYNFHASKAVEFNIHYHEGYEVLYLAQETGLDEAGGVVTVPLTTEICAMWQYESFGAPAEIDYALELAGAAEAAAPDIVQE